ncbi:MAG: hypothetical protein JWN44_3599 [Myxococcales bacterium]|nr:hypothetical protein [Myxococcales bacterium]
MSERVLTREFWFGDVDARVLALFRIGLGATLFTDLLDRLRDLHAFYTEGGVMPLAFAYLTGGHWSLLQLSGSDHFVVAFFLLALVATAAMTVGLFSRAATIATWVVTVSIQHRNLSVCDSGDTVLRVMCFWAMFADLGARFSLDVRLGRRPLRRFVAAAPLRLMQAQLAAIYLYAAATKVGPSWWDGTAVLRAVQNSDFARPLGLVVARFPRLCAFFDHATLATEWTLPLLIFSPWQLRRARIVAIVAALALHVGIALTMRIGVFSVIMPVCMILLAPVAAAPPAPETTWRRVGLSLGIAQLILAGVEQHGNYFEAESRPNPVLAAEVSAVALWQNWSMFAPEPPAYFFRWQAPGELSDGSPVEALSRVAPHMLPEPGWRYSRWYKLRQNLEDQSRARLLAFGQYVCRRHNEATAAERLARFTLVLERRPMPVRGAHSRQLQRLESLQQRCLDAPPGGAL